MSEAAETTDTSRVPPERNVQRNGRGYGGRGGRGGRGYGRYSGRNDITVQAFRGKIENLAVLGTKDEKKGDSFLTFQKELYEYVLANYKHPSDIAHLVKELENPMRRLIRSMPTTKSLMIDWGLDPDDTSPSAEDKAIIENLNELLGSERKTFTERRSILSQNLAKMFGLVWGQCTPKLREDIMGMKEYQEKSSEYNCLWLLENLKTAVSGADRGQYEYLSHIRALRSLITCRQQDTDSVEKLSDNLASLLENFKLMGGELVSDVLVDNEKREDSTLDTAQAKIKVENKLLGAMMIEASNDKKYAELKRSLHNSMSEGHNRYPEDRQRARTMLSKYKPASVTNNRRIDRNGRNGPVDEETSNLGGVSFYQRAATVEGPPIAGTNGHTEESITCWTCGRKGHRSPVCPTADTNNENGAQGMQGMQFLFSQDKNGNNDIKFVKDSWLLIDTGSTFNSVKNKDLINNIKDCDPMNSLANGGSMVYNKVGTLNLLQNISVYYNPESIANILSMAHVTSTYRVTMDSDVEDAIFVHIGDNETLKFTRCGNGLYYYDTNSKTKQTVAPYILFSTVAANKQYYTSREIQGADEARILQSRIGWPSDSDYKNIIMTNQVTDCSTTPDNIVTGNAIYGPMVPILQGKMVRKKNQHKAQIERVAIPSPILKSHPSDSVSADFFFVEGKPYLLMKSRVYKFHGLNCSKGRGKVETIKALKTYLNKFGLRGITITSLHGDNEFTMVEEALRPIHVEIAARGEHVGDIERNVRTVKERCRCTTTSLPYKRVPRIMIDANIEDKIHWLNEFTPRDYIHPTMGPSGMILGIENVNVKHLRINYGAYCQVYETTKNDISSKRSVGAIALRPRNNRGSYYFMSLESKRKLHATQWTELPVTDAVKARVEALAIEDDVEEMKDGELNFEWAPGQPIIDIEEDNVDGPAMIIDNNVRGNTGRDLIIFDEEKDDHNEDEEERVTTESNDNDNEIHHTEQTEIATELDITSEYSTVDVEEDHIDDTDNKHDNNSEHDENMSIGNNEDVIEEQQQDHNIDVPEIDTSQNTEEPSVVLRRSGRDKKKTTKYTPSFIGQTYDTYDAQMHNVMQEDVNKIHNTTNDLSHIPLKVLFAQVGNEENGEGNFEQMSFNRGQKLFGERAVAAMFKEYQQMEDMAVLELVNPDSLTSEQKYKALRAVNLIKQKRNLKIKGRMCANGAPHRKFVPREEARSPTISLDALVASMMIDSYERRKVAVFDIPGAYLQTDLPDDKFALLKLEGQFVDIMCEINSEYIPAVRNEKEQKVLYLRVRKAIYGMIESALLWYELYTSVLMDMGFKLNPYDHCVANKIINGKQCTIAWYVDDNKISHVEQQVLDDIIGKIEERFPGLTIEKGDTHTFLGIKVKYMKDQKVSISMREYILESIEEFGEEISTVVSSPGARWLFSRNEKARKLDGRRKERFISVVMKLLWLIQRGRPDCTTPISYLCTRAKEPDIEDWKKLKRLLCFLKQTINEERIIGAKDLHKMQTFIDSSHAVHENMRGHTGGVTTFGTGVLGVKSSKQKMNSRSSMETEVIGNSEYLPCNIWFEYFMGAQGYNLTSNILWQDNEAAERMAKGGRLACSSKSKHIDVKFFWIHDRVKQGKIDVRHCPTDLMLADFFTKPLQGAKFNKFRRIIMGWDDIDSLQIPLFNSLDGTTKERVEKNEITVVESSATFLPE